MREKCFLSSVLHWRFLTFIAHYNRTCIRVCALLTSPPSANSGKFHNLFRSFSCLTRLICKLHRVVAPNVGQGAVRYTRKGTQCDQHYLESISATLLYCKKISIVRRIRTNDTLLAEQVPENWITRTSKLTRQALSQRVQYK